MVLLIFGDFRYSSSEVTLGLFSASFTINRTFISFFSFLNQRKSCFDSGNNVCVCVCFF